MKTDTLLMIGGLGLLGVGVFYMMNKSQASGTSDLDARINAAVAASGARNAQQAAEMRKVIESQASQLASNDKNTQRAAEQDLTAQYIAMGFTGAAALAAGIAELFKPKAA